MSDLLHHLERLDRGAARKRALRRATWWHRALLVGAVVLAFVSRAITPLPGLAAIEGQWIPVALVAVGLLLVGVGLLALARWQRRGNLQTLARRIDDAQAWHDDTSTAEGLQGPGAESAAARALVEQGAGRLATLADPKIGRVARVAGWPRVILVLLFAFILLAPGVDGLLGLRGAGQGQDDGLGQQPDVAAETAPLEAAWFLTVFARDPLPVEMLPEDAGAAEGDDAAAPSSEGDE